MTNKPINQDLPPEFSNDPSDEIAREIEFVAAIRQGLEELANGESIPIDEVKRELPKWITK